MKAIKLTGDQASYIKTKEDGTRVRVYRYQVVSDIETYTDAVGDKLRSHTNGNPLWFTPFVLGNEVELYVSKNGQVNASTEDHDRVVQLIEQNKGTAVGNHIAEQYAKQLLGNAFSKGVSQPAPQPAPQASQDDDMGTM